MPNESMLVLLQRATHVTLHVLETQLADLGLKAAEVNVLANLADGRSRTVSELGAAAGVRVTTLTGVLDRLEQKGHIIREARPGDRRVVQISLSEAGAKTSRVIHRAFADLEERALAGLSPTSRQQASHVLSALAAS
jgi:DNA-binding MarR family transcriptional regulator